MVWFIDNFIIFFFICTKSSSGKTNLGLVPSFGFMSLSLIANKINKLFKFIDLILLCNGSGKESTFDFSSLKLRRGYKVDVYWKMSQSNP